MSKYLTELFSILLATLQTINPFIILSWSLLKTLKFPLLILKTINLKLIFKNLMKKMPKMKRSLQEYQKWLVKTRNKKDVLINLQNYKNISFLKVQDHKLFLTLKELINNQLMFNSLWILTNTNVSKNFFIFKNTLKKTS